MYEVRALRPHPPSIHAPADRDGRQAREREPAVLLEPREGDGGAGAQDLEDVDDGVLDARKARALSLVREGLRQLLRGEIVDPDAEAREGEEREQDHAPAHAERSRRRSALRKPRQGCAGIFSDCLVVLCGDGPES